MTVKEAIKILNPDADVVWKAYDGKDMERCNEACRVACVALAKQIPIKPDYEGDGYDENGNLIYDTWICRIVVNIMRLIMTIMISAMNADRL